MTAEESQENMGLYLEMFGELPDSRLCPDETLDNMDELIAMALERGSALTKKETGVATAPDGVTI